MNTPRKTLDPYINDRIYDLVNDMWFIGNVMSEQYEYFEADNTDSETLLMDQNGNTYVVHMYDPSNDDEDDEDDEDDDYENNDTDAGDQNDAVSDHNPQIDPDTYPLSRKVLSEKFFNSFFFLELEHMEKILRGMNDIRIYIQRYTIKQKQKLVGEIYNTLQNIQKEG